MKINEFATELYNFQQNNKTFNNSMTSKQLTKFHEI